MFQCLEILETLSFNNLKLTNIPAIRFFDMELALIS